jgi:hypothetical protein
MLASFLSQQNDVAKFINTHQLNNEAIRLLLVSLASGHRPPDSFVSSTLRSIHFVNSDFTMLPSRLQNSLNGMLSGANTICRHRRARGRHRLSLKGTMTDGTIPQKIGL